MIRAVLLDMGGVLLDMAGSQGLPTGRPDWRGREVMARRLGSRVTLDDLESLLFAPWRREHERRHDLGHEASWESHLRRLRRHAASRQHTLTLLRDWFRPYAEQVAPFPGASETLAALRERGLALALVSNVPLPGRLYREVLARFGLAAPFRSLWFSYDAGTRKPSPALLRAALAALGVGPEEAVMVGDRRGSDVAAGRAAGAATVWLRGDAGAGPEPDRTIGRLEELPAALASL